MAAKKKAAKKKAAKKKGGGGYDGSDVSYGALVTQVRLLNDWIHALKVDAGHAGDTIEVVQGGRPDPGGGPPGI